jgi:sulfite reductase (NADPH) flavoprotein alpha-component
VWPRNSPKYIRDLLGVAGFPEDAPVTVDGVERPLQEFLGETFEITTITRPFVKAYAAATNCSELEALLAPDQQDSLQRYAFGREIIDVLSTYPPVGVSASAFVGMLRRLQPRFYSVASSLRAHEDEVHLLIGLTRYESYGRVREGVCSSYLCQRLREDEPVRIFPSPNPTFKLPSDPDARIIMIGPGTGVAPFRAFIEDREAAACRGRNWLFFGDQHFTTDFLYQIEWQRWHKAGVLSHLDLAFSRDQAQKVYVQHRLVEKGRDVYDWLQQGACVYVCGDAERMAVDVHEALLSIVGQHGGQDRDAAEEYLQRLQTDKRYQRDVY